MQGRILHFGTSADMVACLSLCKSTDRCAWFSFHTVLDQTCILFEDCPEIEEDPQFVSGQKECDYPPTTTPTTTTPITLRTTPTTTTTTTTTPTTTSSTTTPTTITTTTATTTTTTTTGHDDKCGTICVPLISSCGDYCDQCKLNGLVYKCTATPTPITGKQE